MARNTNKDNERVVTEETAETLALKQAEALKEKGDIEEGAMPKQKVLAMEIASVFEANPTAEYLFVVQEDNIQNIFLPQNIGLANAHAKAVNRKLLQINRPSE